MNCDEMFTVVIDSFKEKFEVRQSGAVNKLLMFSVYDKEN